MSDANGLGCSWKIAGAEKMIDNDGFFYDIYTAIEFKNTPF